MHIKDLYSIVVTEKRAECRDFYVRWFSFQVLFEASWFVYLAATGTIPLASRSWPRIILRSLPVAMHSTGKGCY
jgi:hypothetical protein